MRTPLGKIAPAAPAIAIYRLPRGRFGLPLCFACQRVAPARDVCAHSDSFVLHMRGALLPSLCRRYALWIRMRLCARACSRAGGRACACAAGDPRPSSS